MDRDITFSDRIQPLRDFRDWIIRVPQTDPEQKRLAQFTAGATAAMGVIASLIGLAGVLAPELAFIVPGVFGGAALFLLAYVLNRRGNYGIAVWAALGTFLALPYGLLLVREKDIATLVLTAAIAAASILYVGAFFPGKKWGLPFSGILVVLYLSLPLIHPGYSIDETAMAAAGIVVIGLMYLVYENHRANLENQRHTQAETESEPDSDLVKQLEDLQIELQATSDEFERLYTTAEEAREEAERANKVKSAFLASMSHELRTPLNAIINLTKFVVDGDMGSLNETQKDTLNEVVGSGKHLLALINDVLDMSKIESGSLNLFVEDNVDLREILDRVSVTGRVLLAEKPVELKVDLANNLPPLRVDRQRIYQVMLNIMANACKFTERGSIKLGAHRTEEEVVISVQDTGPGIAAEDQALVFEAFKQTATGLRQSGGTGLGMPISKNLIEAHGGRLWLESELGTGSTFFIALPVQAQPQATVSAVIESNE